MIELFEKIGLISDEAESDILKGLYSQRERRRKKYIIAGVCIFLLIFIIIIISVSSKGKNETKRENMSKYYSKNTKEYLELISNLEKNNSIAYHWTFDDGLTNKYQYLYDNIENITSNDSSVKITLDTSLHLMNKTFEPFYTTTEHIRLSKDNEELNYYKDNPNSKAKKHYIFGPSSIMNQMFFDGQQITSTDVRINIKKWGGFTLILNLRGLSKGNNSSGKFFGWGSDDYGKVGCWVNLVWSELVFKCGNAHFSIGERPFLKNQNWHQAILSVRKAEKDDLIYLKKDITSIKEGDYFFQAFIDGVSKKNQSVQVYEDYGDLKGFYFNNSTQFNDNENWYMDDIMVFKKGITLEEALIFNNTIINPTEHITPVIKGRRCNMPGMKFGPLPGQFYNESKKELSAKIKFLHLSNKWSCLGIDYNPFFIEMMKEYCGEQLIEIDNHRIRGETEDYFHRYTYLYDLIDIYDYYFPKIYDYLHNLTSLKKYITIISTDSSGSNKKTHDIVNYGVFLNSEGLLRVPYFAPNISDYIYSSFPHSIYYIYFELKDEYKENRIYTIKLKGSNEEKIIYNDKKLISQAIKVNQVSYSPNVDIHFAYVGRFLGTYGYLPVEQYINKSFYIYNKNDQRLFEGIITWRSNTDYIITTEESNCSINGERTLSLDFSNFTEKGEDFYIYIPEIGRSYSFSISNKGVFEAFYTSFRGFYHQRTGKERKKPFTNWELGAHHKGIYVAHHIPNNAHYGKYITNDKTGNILTGFDQFKMINLTGTEEFWEDVYGGHADAGDFDNRPYHLRIIENLAAIWFKKKDILADNQFNLPESGDGIPDILNEMEWNLQIHYLVQQKFGDGSVSTWIESTSHPGFTGDLNDDPAKYYVGLRTREDTMRYIVAAGVLSLAYKECDSCPIKFYEKWKKSAEWAWKWAIKEENRCIYHFKYKEENYTYREPDVPEDMVARAAIIMYKLSNKDPQFEKYIFKNKTAKIFDDKYTQGVFNLQNGLSAGPFAAFPAIFFLDDSDFAIFFDRVRTLSKMQMSIFMDLQNNGTQYTYRNAYFYQYDHVYYKSLGWGNFIGSTQIDFLVMGYYLYENAPGYEDLFSKLKNSLGFFFDFNLGCNHYGRTFTTGLGKIYPLRYVSHPNGVCQQRGIWDPIPGITLYFFNGNIHYDEISLVQQVNYDQTDYYNFKGANFNPCPFFFNLTKQPKDYSEAKAVLTNVLPFWHRTTNLESFTIAQSEYTIYETIARMTMMAGMLLEKDEKNVKQCTSSSNCPSVFPPDELKYREPKVYDHSYTGWQIP